MIIEEKKGRMVMKNYQVTVNGVVYQVSVEELAGAAPIAPTPLSAPVPAAPAAPAVQKSAPAPAGGNAVKAPMPGTVNKINVKVGDSVKRGDVLCVLEAMKMENDICAPEDGVVAAVVVEQGTSVATDAVLFTLR